MDVRQRWVRAGGPDEAFDDIVVRYAEPHRAYHTMHHVEHVLSKVDEIGYGDDPAVVLAVILHDVIYAPERDDNEERSVDYARRVLAGHDAIDRVASLIAATKSHDGTEGDGGLDALLDADLSTFADDDEGKNGDLIRQEYAAVPADAFRAGRKRILQQFLEREPLYRTELMRTRYEAKAKANIQRAIDRLDAEEVG
jgi:predicted metal-dependent HD superfamily phosphohydrolase